MHGHLRASSTAITQEMALAGLGICRVHDLIAAPLVAARRTDRSARKVHRPAGGAGLRDDAARNDTGCRKSGRAWTSGRSGCRNSPIAAVALAALPQSSGVRTLLPIIRQFCRLSPKTCSEPNKWALRQKLYSAGERLFFAARRLFHHLLSHRPLFRGRCLIASAVSRIAFAVLLGIPLTPGGEHLLITHAFASVAIAFTVVISHAFVGFRLGSSLARLHLGGMFCGGFCDALAAGGVTGLGSAASQSARSRRRNDGRDAG